MDADSFKNDLDVTFMWSSEDLSAGVSFEYNKSLVSVSGINTDNMESFKLSDNSLYHEADLFFPVFHLGYKNNNVKLSVKDKVEYSFNLEFPILNNINLGLHHETYPLADFPFKLFGDYNFKTTLELSRNSIYMDYTNNNYYIKGIFSLNKLETAPDLTDDKNISFKYVMESDYSLSINFKMYLDKNIFEINLNTEKYSIDRDHFYGFKGNELFLALQNKFNIYNSGVDLLFLFNKTSIWFSQSFVNVGSFKFNATTYPYIYGPIAYLNYHISVPEIYLFNSGIGVDHEFNTVIGDLILGAGIGRFYGDWNDITFFYDEYTALLGRPSLIGSSDVYEYILEQNHLNIFHIKLEDTISFSEGLALSISLNQYIPFFDSSIKRLFNKSNSSGSGSSSSDESFFGGTNISISLKYDF